MKIDRILFPIDFSGYSQELNNQVEWLAQTFQSHVTLLHVFEIPTGWYGGIEGPILTAADLAAIRDSENQRLKEYKINIPEAQLTRITLEGGVAWQIAKWVETHATDSIVMGTHGFGPLRRLLLGSVAMNVLHDVDCPIWTQAPGSTKHQTFHPVKNILCLIELTEEAVPLLRFAKSMSTAVGATVRLIHTTPLFDDPLVRYLDAEFHRHLNDLASEEIARRQQEAGTAFPVSITNGHITQDTAEMASDQEVDLILIGRGKARGVLGSLRTHAYDIIRGAPCPVLSYSADRLANEESVVSRENLVGAAPSN